MSQAFDDDGNKLGREHFGDSMREAFEHADTAHPDAKEILTRRLTEFERDVTLHGELYVDDEGEAHFVCHTPGDMPFDEARAGLSKFVKLLQDKLDAQAECPYFPTRKGT